MGQSGRALCLGQGGNNSGDDVKRQVDSGDHKRAIYQLVNVKTGGGKLIELIQQQQQQVKYSLSSFSRGVNDDEDDNDADTVQVGQRSTKNYVSTSISVSNAQVNVSSLDASIARPSNMQNLINRKETQLDRHIRELVAPLLYNDGRGKLVHLSRLWARRFGQETDQAEGSVNGSDEINNDEDQTGERRMVCWKLEERGFVGETGLHICFLLSSPTHMILARKLLKMFPMLINDIYTNDEYFGESSLVS